ncbi:hypothetical protein QQ054_18155 [Oscillatoria amoena NRMC-F 0135]|nr:hypothetical protein [Oscillatoria amoena NRMC-F 0135]
MKNLNLTSLFLLAYVLPALSNDGLKPSSLSQQYQNLVSNLEVVEGYRMIKAYEVDRFWRSVSDSLRSEQSRISGLVKANAGLTDEVARLKEVIDQKNTATSELEFAGKHITVLRRDFKKQAFIMVVAGLVSLLLAAIGLLIYFGKAAYITAAEARKLYEEQCREFEQYRHNAIEKQIKISRELQDFRNRQMELRSA